MSDQNADQSGVKMRVVATLEINDKETGRKEKKVFKDGIMSDHVIIDEGKQEEG